MSKISIYLNFNRTTEAAFRFYETVFGTKIIGEIARIGDVPSQDGMPPLPDAEKNLVMHVALPILGGVQLMGTDILESMGHVLKPGNNVYINLQPDTRAETEKLFNALAENGKVEMPLQEMFWGAYFGSLTDKFGTNWMFNCEEKK